MRTAIVVSAIIIAFAMTGNNEMPTLLTKNFENFKGLLIVFALADFYDMVINLLSLFKNVNTEQSETQEA